MNTIISNGSYAYRNTQQADRQKSIRSRSDYLESTRGQFYEETEEVHVKASGISAQDAYERVGGSGNALPEAGENEERKDMTAEENGVKKTTSLAELAGLPPGTHVTEIGIMSLPNGISFYFNGDTGEVSCVNDKDSRPGRHALWSRILSPEELERCDKLFDSYKDIAAGGFTLRYRAYLKHEDFWDMYLEGKVDLTKLIESDDMLNEDELYHKFLRDIMNGSHKDEKTSRIGNNL